MFNKSLWSSSTSEVRGHTTATSCFSTCKLSIRLESILAAALFLNSVRQEALNGCAALTSLIDQLWPESPSTDKYQSHAGKRSGTESKWGQLSADSLNLLFMDINYELSLETFVMVSAAAAAAASCLSWKRKRDQTGHVYGGTRGEWLDLNSSLPLDACESFLLSNVRLIWLFTALRSTLNC